MIMKLKKSKSLFIKTLVQVLVLLSFSSLFFSCKYDPETMIPMTPEEICAYMNDNFEGTFELFDSKSEDSNKEKSNTAYMKCSLFSDRTIVTKHGYEESKFGWRKTFLTNYYEIYYSDDVEKLYSGMIEEWFGAFDYKYVNSTSAFLNILDHYSNFEEYLKSSPLIYYTVVVKTSDEQMEQYALQKAKSVGFDIRNKREYPLRLYLYFWVDDGFDALTDDFIKDLRTTYESDDRYYYVDENLENYSW